MLLQLFAVERKKIVATEIGFRCFCEVLHRTRHRIRFLERILSVHSVGSFHPVILSAGRGHFESFDQRRISETVFQDSEVIRVCQFMQNKIGKYMLQLEELEVGTTACYLSLVLHITG